MHFMPGEEDIMQTWSIALDSHQLLVLPRKAMFDKYCRLKSAVSNGQLFKCIGFCSITRAGIELKCRRCGN